MNLSTTKTKTYSKAIQVLKKQKNEENSPAPLPSDLNEIISKWDALPDHIKQTIKTLVSSVTVTSEENNK